MPGSACWQQLCAVQRVQCSACRACMLTCCLCTHCCRYVGETPVGGGTVEQLGPGTTRVVSVAEPGPKCPLPGAAGIAGGERGAVGVDA